MKINQQYILKECRLSVYKIKWLSGGSSVASIYMTSDGTLMISPSNWLAPHPLSECVEDIKWIKELKF